MVASGQNNPELIEIVHREEIILNSPCKLQFVQYIHSHGKIPQTVFVNVVLKKFC